MAVSYQTIHGKRACSCQRATYRKVEAGLIKLGVIKTDLSGLITQGAYSSGVAASAGTHGGGGVWDAKASLVDTDAKRAVWFAAGVIPFYRITADAPVSRWSPHGHLVWAGCAHRTKVAAAQEASARSGRNGLANQGSFRGKLPPKILTWKQAVDPVPAPPTVQFQVATEAKPLNGRSGPGTSYPVIASAARGSLLGIVEVRAGWGRAQNAWYSFQYLDKPKPPAPTPKPPAQLVDDVWAAVAAWNLQNPDLASSVAAGVKRNADKQGAWLRAEIRASVYAVCELGKGELARLVAALGPTWRSSAHPHGGVAVVYDSAKWTAKPTRSASWGTDQYRGAHCQPLVHKASGIGVDMISVHILPGVADEVKRGDIRTAAALAGKWPAVLMGDFNTRWPQKQLHGWTLATPEHADTMDAPGTQVLDAILTRGLHGSRAAAVIDSKGLSDHYAVRSALRLDAPKKGDAS